MPKTCPVVLEKPPACEDIRRSRQWVFCKAWEMIDKEGLGFKEAVKKAWGEKKKVCEVESSQVRNNGYQ